MNESLGAVRAGHGLPSDGEGKSGADLAAGGRSLPEALPKADGAAADPTGFITRITYLMLFRVVVSVLLLGAAVAAGLAEQEGMMPEEIGPQPTAALFFLVGVNFGLTLLWAALVRSVRTLNGGVRLAKAQVVCDLLTTTALVHYTGGVDSAFVFLYLLVIVGAATVLSQWTSLTPALTAAMYLAVAVGGRLGVLPEVAGHPSGPLAPVARTLAINVVAILATSVLASRLIVELRRASEHIVAQGEQLQDLAALHNDVVRSLTSGLLTLRDDGTIQSLNPAGAELMGRMPAEVAGRPLEALWPGFEAAMEQQPSLPLRRTELAITRPDGEQRIVGLSESKLLSPQGGAVGRVVSFQDLTELRRMARQMERTERLATIGQLAAGVAHEIRNPLAAISGSIEMLRASARDHGEQDSELWDIVGREIDRLNAQVGDLLEFARPRAPVFERLDVSSTVAELLRVFENDRKLAGRRVRLEARSPAWVDADPTQLRQVLWNLLRNAVEAAPGGDPVEVRVAVGEAALRPERSELDREAEAGWVELSIRDRGVGIAEADRARLFEPFATTKKGGTGLGLATVHRIIEDHHGRVEVVPADGGGTRATVYLPRRPPPGT